MSTWAETISYIKSQLRPSVLGGTDVQKILNSLLAITGQFNAGDSSPSTDALWKAGDTYAQDVAPVLWRDTWLVSNIPGNIGNVPISNTGIVHPTWRVVGSSPGSGLRIWSSLVYPNELEVVFYSGVLYYLDREIVEGPFHSVDFAAELLDGKWKLLNIGGMGNVGVGLSVDGDGKIQLGDGTNVVFNLLDTTNYRFGYTDDFYQFQDGKHSWAIDGAVRFSFDRTNGIVFNPANSREQFQVGQGAVYFASATPSLETGGAIGLDTSVIELYGATDGYFVLNSSFFRVGRTDLYQFGFESGAWRFEIDDTVRFNIQDGSIGFTSGDFQSAFSVGSGGVNLQSNNNGFGVDTGMFYLAGGSPDGIAPATFSINMTDSAFNLSGGGIYSLSYNDGWQFQITAGKGLEVSMQISEGQEVVALEPIDGVNTDAFLISKPMYRGTAAEANEMVTRSEVLSEISAVGGTLTRTSTSSLLIGTGLKSFAFIETPTIGWVIGQRLRAANSPTNWMEGVITDVTTTGVIIQVDRISGAGSFSLWNIGIAGQPGEDGAGGSGGGSTKSKSSTVIRFDADYTIGSPEVPSNVELAIIPDIFEPGVRLIIYHSYPTLPAFLSGWTNIGATSYLTGFNNLNIIEVTFHTFGLVTYVITAFSNPAFFTDKIPRRNLVLEALMTNLAPSVVPDTSFQPVAGTLINSQQVTVWHDDPLSGLRTPLLCRAVSSSTRSYAQFPISSKLGLAVPFAISFYHRIGDLADILSNSSFQMFASHFGTGTTNFGVSGQTTSDVDLTYDIRLNRNAANSTLRRLRVTGDPNFQASRTVFKHLFIWYTGTIFGMRINDQFEVTLSTADVLNVDVTQSSPFFIGAVPTTVAATSVNGNAHFIRNFRVWVGYIPNVAERTALKNELNHLLS